MVILANDIGQVFLLGIIVVILLVLIYFLFKSIRKDINIEKENRKEKIDGVISKGEISSLISTYIERTGHSSNFSLIYIDLDKFEDFKTAFGRKEANNIIKIIASKIKNNLPRNSYVSRYSGDEFLVFLSTNYDREEVLDFGKELLSAFREKITIFGETSIDLTASIAIAQYPIHGRSLDNLLESLKLTIHNIKKSGGNQMKMYSESFEHDEENMNYYYQIKEAIGNKEFMLFYQPIVYETGKPYAYEALLRWEHPELGVLAPNKFINIMEQTGDIHWVGYWGFEELVKKYLDLRSLKQEVPLLTINISPKQLMNKEIAVEFSKILKKYRVDASNFVLEIGEFLMFEKQEVVFENIVKLKRLNFKLAIDEFGIDISSFDLLDNMGVDIVKIDYKFIKEDSFSVNKYMEVFEEYATKTDIDIICQGIEDKASEKRAKDFNITKFQGYYYSKPIKSSEVDNFEL